MPTDFSGLCVALATPFQASGAIDLGAFQHLVRHVVRGGVDVLIPLGSTGEAATLSDNERDALVETCLAESRGRAVVVGTGSNNTAQSAAWTKRAKQLGAHGALVVTPYYNKPMPSGIAAHFRAVADAAPGFPIVAYNVPGRTGTNLAPSTLAKLWENPQVVAVKESSGNLAQIGEIARALPREKLLLAGDDNLALATIAVGGGGLVSVAANVAPALFKELVVCAREGQVGRARELHQRLLPLMDALFVESNPIPLKAGLELLGLGTSMLRLPLTRPEEATRRRVGDAMRSLGLFA
jgi:4-hydroxy-tetrahydrodipicolinate synthase